MDRHQRIADLNDAFRRSMAGGRVYITRGVADLAEPDQGAILAKVRAFEELFRGTIDGASVHPREVVKAALAHNAAACILAHNHPSGVGEPSHADRQITERHRGQVLRRAHASYNTPVAERSPKQQLDCVYALNVDDGQHVLVSIPTLWSLCAASSAPEALADTVQARIATLEKEAERQWYGRDEA